MPNLDFYAIGVDITDVLEILYQDASCRVFESYSEFDRPLREFCSAQEIATTFKLGELPGDGHNPLLALVPIGQFSHTRLRRINLNAARCSGATFRFCLEGWGLIQLQLGGLCPKGLVECHTNHNSERRAAKWEDVYSKDLGPSAAWDWREVTKLSNRINRQIRRLAVGKAGSRPVLPNAAQFIKSGAKFVRWYEHYTDS